MFVYCNDIKCKEALVKQGFKLISEEEGSTSTWVFEHNDKLEVPVDFIKQVRITKKMSF